MKKKLLLFILSVLCIITVIFTFSKVKADSGWDSSYDSDWGSSWDSSYDSSWDSNWDSSYGSSWDSGGYSSRRSGSSSNSSVDAFFMLIIMIVLFIYIFFGNKNIKKNKSKSLPKQLYTDVSDELLAKYGINKEEFKKMVYQKYVDIQKAWTNFDYDKLKDNLTNELYNSYVMQLDALKLKKQKNIMSDFCLMDVKIIDVNDTNGIINAKTYLNVRMYDYVVDKDNKVVRGNKNIRIDIEYVIEFVRALDPSKEMKCPNCGAPIDTITTGVCEYCRAKIVIPAKDYVMSKKTNVGQRSV